MRETAFRVWRGRATTASSSAIVGMSQHLVLDNWQEMARDIKRWSDVYGLELLAMERRGRTRLGWRGVSRRRWRSACRSSTAGRARHDASRDNFQHRSKPRSLADLARSTAIVCASRLMSAPRSGTRDDAQGDVGHLFQALRDRYGTHPNPSIGRESVEAIRPVSRVTLVHIRTAKREKARDKRSAGNGRADIDLSLHPSTSREGTTPGRPRGDRAKGTARSLLHHRGEARGHMRRVCRLASRAEHGSCAGGSACSGRGRRCGSTPVRSRSLQR